MSLNHLLRLSAFLMSLMVSTCMSAQVYVSHFTGESGSKALATSDTTITLSCAAAFTADGLLAPYQQCDLGVVSISVTSPEGLSSFQVWVRPHLDAPNLVEVNVPVESLASGWNPIELPHTIALAGHDTLYCGYSFTQHLKKVSVITYGGRKKTPLSFYIANNGRWTNYNSTCGPLCLRAGIVGTHDYVLHVQDAWLDGRSLAFVPGGQPAQSLTVHATIQNLGRQPISSLVLDIADYGVDVQSVTLACPEIVTFGQSITLCHTLMPGCGVDTPTYDVPLQMALHSPDAQAEALVFDSLRTLYYDLYDASRITQPSPHLVEVFTSERSGFAPLAQQRLQEALSAVSKNDDRSFIVIAHHEGFGPADPWRVTSRSDYDARLFGPQQLTFAPAALVNRHGLPFSTTQPVDTLINLLETVQPMPSIVQMDLEAQLDAGRITAQVKVRPQALTLCADPQLVLCLVQPQAQSIDQHNYYPELCDDQQQTDIIRCFLHNANGNDALFPAADMTSIMRGTVPFSAYYPSVPDVSLTAQYSAVVPSDITSLSGLRLVAYIYDRSATGHIFTAYSRSF